MKDAILRKARESADVKEQFFRAEADRIEALARTMLGVAGAIEKKLSTVATVLAERASGRR